MNSRIFLKTFVVLFIMISCKESGSKTTIEDNSIQTPPNIILIMADDQGWGDLGHSGNTNLSTPNIDALAQNGVSFTHFFVQPVCSPTRAELLTGKYFTRLGIHGTSAGGERMDPSATTLAEILKKEGYKTAAYGKWHNGMQAPYHPNAQGFDDFYGFASGHWGNYFSPMLEHNGQLVKGNGYLVDDLTQHGLEFIEKNKENPFFLYLPLNTPHSPMQVPDAYWNRFKDKELAMTYQGEENEDKQITTAALAMVENIDGNVGKITQKLRDLELEENTIVIYLSDNGPSDWRWNGGMRGKKGSTDEGGVRTPFFIQWKNTLTAGTEITEIASVLDVLPTLLSMIGLSTKQMGSFDGKNLQPLFFQDNPVWQDRMIFNHWNGRTSIRTQKYRLDSEERLYDMTTDYGQTKDVSKTFPTIKDSLVKAKQEWLNNIVPMTKATDNRPFTLGHPDYAYTQLPARDGIGHGKIKRSNRYPNNTFFTNWTREQDSISWDVEVLEKGNYKTTLYYTLPQQEEGLVVHLINGKNNLSTIIPIAHDPPLMGMEDDRTPRMESYVKDFRPIDLGTIFLQRGRRPMVLKTSNNKSGRGLDVRLLLFERVE
ncbi:arylsulfatase [Maribacter chungangensis]|uniref:Arylsulfatase n=1 Tax=Maribacter chungangensis TaxID=1069117 RepID=A0ABW3B3Z7_9FLAO